MVYNLWFIINMTFISGSTQNFIFVENEICENPKEYIADLMWYVMDFQF